MFFSEKDHKYYKKISGDYKYISASAVADHYSEDFDKEYWSLYKAYEFLAYRDNVDSNASLELYLDKTDIIYNKKIKEYFKQFRRGYNFKDYNLFKHLRLYMNQKVAKTIKDIILKRWKEENKISLIKGSLYHDYRESTAEFIGELVNPHTNNKLDVISCNEALNSNIKKRSVDIVHLPNGVYNELIINFKMFTGQVDRLFLEYRNFWLRDFKTNKELVFKNPFQKMKYPLQHLDDCNWNHYRIQLSIYIWILIQLGYNYQGTVIEHCIFNETTNKWNVIEYPLEYLEDEIETLITDIMLNIKH